MHDFFATAKFTLVPQGIPLPDGESTPPMSAIMRSFGEAEVVPFAQPRSAWTKSRKSGAGRRRTTRARS